MFKSRFWCKAPKTESFSSFEVLLFQLNEYQLAIAVVYRPPKPNKDKKKEL